MYEIHAIEKDETHDTEKDEIATLKKVVVGGLRLSLVVFDDFWCVHIAFGGFMSLLEGVAFGGYCFWRMLLLEGVAFGWRCFWRAYVAFGGHKLLHFPYLRSTGPGEGTGYVLSLRVKTYELMVLGGRKGKGG
ncbi:17852_t:CDS:2 [Gigaspora rosea]|nr:17852_t:CDS:2 [Gigaspora rosea]